jgi:hypothetical protein
LWEHQTFTTSCQGYLLDVTAERTEQAVPGRFDWRSGQWPPLFATSAPTTSGGGKRQAPVPLQIPIRCGGLDDPRLPSAPGTAATEHPLSRGYWHSEEGHRRFASACIGGFPVADTPNRRDDLPDLAAGATAPDLLGEPSVVGRRPCRDPCGPHSACGHPPMAGPRRTPAAIRTTRPSLHPKHRSDGSPSTSLPAPAATASCFPLLPLSW